MRIPGFLSASRARAALGDFLGSAQRKDQQSMAEMSSHANGAESRSNHEQSLPSGDQFYGRFNPRTTVSNGFTWTKKGEIKASRGDERHGCLHNVVLY